MDGNTVTIDIADERERLKSKMDDVADRQVDIALEDETGVAQQELSRLQSRGTDLQEYRDALEAWDVDEITVRKLTAGDSYFLADFVDDNQGIAEDAAFIAIGTVDAPYLEHDPDSFKRDPEAVLETVGAVCDLDIPVSNWLEERISELSHLGAGTGNEYTNLLLDKLMERVNTTEMTA